MKRYERLAALFLILVGITTGLHAWLNLGLGNLQLPDSGFMPFLGSLLLIGCSLIWLLGNLGPDSAPVPFWAGRDWLRPLLSVLLMLFYAWSIDWLGYLLATLVFMLTWQLGIERERWQKAGLIALASTAVMYLLFAKLLAVPLPTGILSV